MSLYEDLTDILTPYADKINQNVASLNDLRDDLDNLDISTDTTLTQSGMVADAEAVGNAINEVKADLANVEGKVDFAQKFLKAFPVESASGSVASFEDGVDDIPLKSLVIDINPIQSGSGDPSPDNVRPISGWTGMQLRTSGEDTSNPTIKAISWETEAGTVYGGTLDVLSGVLTVDSLYNVYDGSEDETWYTYASSGFRIPTGNKTSPDASGVGLCNMAHLATSASEYGVSFSLANKYIYFFQSVSEWGVSTVSELRTWLATHNVEVWYKANTQVTYQLTPQEVNTLLGINNIWADTGDVNVEYRADPTLYADKLTRGHMLAIAPVETAYTATRNYTTGQLLIVGNTLYKVTANIANNGSITPNTNVVATTLSEIISALA